MYAMLDAHFLSVVIVVGSLMVTPVYILAVYTFSEASASKGLKIGIAFLIWGALMFWVCLSRLPARMGLAGALIGPLSWLTPSMILYWQ